MSSAITGTDIVRGINIVQTYDVPALERLHEEICEDLKANPDDKQLIADRDRVKASIDGWHRWARVC